MTSRRKMRIGGGQNGKWLFQGIFAFTTTGATVTIPVPMGRVESTQLTAIGTPASDEELSVNNTVAGTVGNDDAAILGSNGSTSLVVTRTGASKTSGLKFALWAIGY